MNIVKGKPPIYSEILGVFPAAAAPGTMFCWGVTIFMPDGGDITPELIVHEKVHCDRQGDSIEAWWCRYLLNQDFRLEEELLAHKAEFKELCRINFPHWVSKNSMRRTFLARTARRLASPLYGPMISLEAAKVALAQ